MLDNALQPSSEPIAVPINEDGKKLEEAADEQEDTLINDVKDKASLLDMARTSYPVLRFSSAKVLLDQEALDKLVGDHPLPSTLSYFISSTICANCSKTYVHSRTNADLHT